MGREPKFKKDLFLDAALELAARGGPKGVTMKGLAQKTGAPIGSIYHRFPGREALLAELWLGLAEDFQTGFFETLGRRGEPGQPGRVNWLEAALYTPRWVRSHFNEAKVLLLFRREDFLSSQGLSKFKKRAEGLMSELGRGIRDCATGIPGDSPAASIEKILFALIDIPFSAVRRHLEAGRIPPHELDDLIVTAVKAVLGDDL